ncbi:MAG: hypothetical protein AAAC48_04235 [Phyllobacterium sp.]|uniref:hypothetical protein n=1 Tax=Phyllobacterium sp. TaxID=1871046 RepID=UPI0030F2A315
MDALITLDYILASVLYKNQKAAAEWVGAELTFLEDDNPNYSKSDGELMQRALEEAAARLNITDETDPEYNKLARFVRAAFIIGNRDEGAIAKFAVDAVLMRRRRSTKNKPAS